MGRIKRNLISLLLVILMVFTICPYTAKGEVTVYTVSDEEGLRDAVAKATDGDTISIEGYISLENGGLEITKDITLNIGEGLSCMSAAAEATLVITGCRVTIKGTDNYKSVSQSYAANAIKVKEGAKDTVLNIEGCGCRGTLATYDDPATAAKVTVNIADGYFQLGEATKLFDVNGGTIVVNGGSYAENPAAYLGENTTVIDKGTSGGTRYEVRSTLMSKEFKQILTDGKLAIPSVVPANEAEAWIYAMAAVQPYSTENAFFDLAPIGSIEDKIFDIYYYDYASGTQEIHRVEAVYTGSIDSVAYEKAKNLMANLPVDDPDNPYSNSSFKIVDMEVINMWASGFNPDAETSKFLEGMANYSGELKKYLGNSNIDFKVVYVGAGEDTDLFLVSIGESVAAIDDVICAKSSHSIGAVAEHVIYVPDETAVTREALMAAAQKRINDYLGDESKVVLSYGGAFNTICDPWNSETDPTHEVNTGYRQFMLDTLGLAAPEHYFTATVNGHSFKLLIVPNSSKMITPTYKTVDIVSNVTIASEAPEIPLDTSIRASKLTSGTTYENIIDKLGVEDNVTFDLKIYSYSQDQYISSVSSDKFKVSIPISTELKGKNLAAYYVDDSGAIKEYAVEVVDNVAVFETDHFSIYTVAEKVETVCTVNGKEHKLTEVAAKDATATAEGNKAYWACDCGKWFADAEGKTEITDKASVILPKLNDTTGGGTENEAPATGDSTNVVLLFGLLLVSAATLLVGKQSKKC